MEALSLFLFSFHALFTCITAADTIAVNQTIRDGQTIVSPQQTFELGFFTPGNTTHNQYLGIWYKRQATGTVVWVANRETPIRNKSGELSLLPRGVLVLRDSATNEIVWSSNSSRAGGNLVARLLDTGNLMVLDGENVPENYIWQSFDHPGNTFLSGMKFGRNLEKGVVVNFTSWKSDDDPSKGQYMTYINFDGFPQVYENDGDTIRYRVGPWNGLAYTSNPSYKLNPISLYEYVSNERETYFIFQPTNKSILTRLVLTPKGNMDRLNWVNPTQGWFQYWRAKIDKCAPYAKCGVYGSCDNVQLPDCWCLKGFTPKRPEQWDIADWRSGCQREIPLDCGVGEGFRKYSFVKLPDTRQSWVDKYMSLEECEVKCKNECNCTAYTTLDIRYNIGCLLWYEELIDIRTFPDDGQDIYIRMAAAELEKDKKIPGRKKKVRTIIAIPIVVVSAILLGLCMLIVRKRRLKAQHNLLLVGSTHGPIAQNEVLHLPLFSLSMLLDATNNFSDDNKLGEGGFGPVYKGSLENGREVAVKRLSERSTQGIEEFKNEVIFISKLQHRNLVKTLGWCIEGEEKLLVYEYMPNRSLELFLFQETRIKILDWSHRFKIMNGIARGLLYLHQDSRLRIIHRDLKASNILLDIDMNPKISDFGIARSFSENETETNTKRVVGTYGYMSPEYATDGIFSVKSDVFSFGVLMLEIVSGKRNKGFFHQTQYHNLLGHAWILYKEGKLLELADAFLIESSFGFEILRSIHVGLLCIQHNPNDRPNMSTVVMMLSGEGQLPEPKQPGFYTEDCRFGPENSSSMQTQNSNNEITITLLEPR